MSTQRKFQRYEVEVAAEVYDANEVLLAATRNLSNGGVCLEVEREIQEGKQIAVSLFLTLDGIEDADEEPLNAKATVVWCSERDAGGFAAGARFETLAGAEQTRLDRFLKALGDKAGK